MRWRPGVPRRVLLGSASPHMTHFAAAVLPGVALGWPNRASQAGSLASQSGDLVGRAHDPASRRRRGSGDRFQRLREFVLGQRPEQPQQVVERVIRDAREHREATRDLVGLCPRQRAQGSIEEGGQALDLRDPVAQPLCLGVVRRCLHRLVGKLETDGEAWLQRVGFASPALLCDTLADRSGRAVRTGPAEATALGNALTQGVALGAFATQEEARASLAPRSR